MAALSADRTETRAFLLLRRVEPAFDSGQADPALDLDAQIIVCDDDGFLSGSHGYRRELIGDHDPSGPWSSPIALYRWPDTPATAASVVVPLPGLDLNFVTVHGLGPEIKEARHRIIERAFSVAPEDYLDGYGFSSLLYIEPTELQLSPEPDQAEYIAVLSRLRGVFGQNRSVAIPQRFRDLIVLPGAFGAGREDLLAIRTGPVPQRHSYTIPRSVFALDRALYLWHTLELAKVRLRRHPLLIASPSEYVTALVPSTTTRMSQSSEARKLAVAYDEHLSDRLVSMTDLHRVRALSAELLEARDSFARNARQVDDDWVWVSEVFSGHPYRTGILARLSQRLESVGREVERVGAELTLRDHAVGDYLRDHLNAAVAHSNLRLQHSLYRLTVIALLAAIAALLAQVVV